MLTDEILEEIEAHLEAQRAGGLVLLITRSLQGYVVILALQPQLQKDLAAKALAAGTSERTLRRAAKNLGVVSVQRGDGWYWSLPVADGQR
jgi:hypothetical protein